MLITLITIFFAFACYQHNFLSFADNNTFIGFQNDSEALVLGGIVADDFALDKKGFNIGFIGKSGVFKYPDNVLDSYALFSEISARANPSFVPYQSQYGIQGIVFSKLHNLYGFNSLYSLQSVNSFLLALVVTALFLLYRSIYDNRFAVIFLITMISSPWIVCFARNLYWVPFLWFMPALLAALLYKSKSAMLRTLLLFGISFSVFIKSLAGYEYLSSITLFTCSVFIVAPFFRDSERNLPGNIRMFCYVFIACIIGFASAFMIHSGMRADSVITGVKNIIEIDVKRRTYGNPVLFDQAIKASLESSALSVVITYVTVWKTPLLAWLTGKLFMFMISLAIIGIFYNYYNNKVTMQREVVIITYFFIVSVSWYVIVKGHSYIHTHINYVLWYFGFVQGLIYVSINTIIVMGHDLIKWVKALNLKD